MLAFVFIPISLATSVFGMNIQELNATGQPIWVFVVTAAITLGTAFSIWAIMYQWTKYIHAPTLRDSSLSSYKDKDSDISSWRRFQALCWLIFHCHLVWCWRSAIIYSLLTSGRLGFTMTCLYDSMHINCSCPREVDVQRIMGTDHEYGGSISTHSPHAPMTYIYAHQAYGSRTAFSFTKAS